jgi:5'-deoxynucleotidase YfbR-like HD superfamily hydrolase
LLFELVDNPAHVSANLLRAALYHDLAECVVGDIPGPIVWALDLKAGASSNPFRQLEEKASEGLGVKIELATEEERCLLKAADLLEGAFATFEQVLIGNPYAIHIMEAWIDHGPAVVGKSTPKSQELFRELRGLYDYQREKDFVKSRLFPSLQDIAFR